MLLDSIVYSEKDISLLKGNEDNIDKEDCANNIKLVFMKAKGKIEGFSDNGNGNLEDQ